MSELKEHLFVPYSELQEGDELTDAITIAKSYYLKSEADEVIAEKDKEIAELKKKLMPCLNGDCILTCEVVEKYGKENAELKKKLEDVNELVKESKEPLKESQKMHQRCADNASKQIRRLKAINAYRPTTNTEDSDVYIHNDDFCCGGDLVECYIKEDADKVIAEKDNELRHHKYKRCLAMAKWSKAGMYLSYECDFKREWWNKWQKRWLEIAEKFKEAE